MRHSAAEFKASLLQARYVCACAPSLLRALMSESISSMKITDGCSTPATANSVLTCGVGQGRVTSGA